MIFRHKKGLWKIWIENRKLFYVKKKKKTGIKMSSNFFFIMYSLDIKLNCI